MTPNHRHPREVYHSRSLLTSHPLGDLFRRLQLFYPDTWLSPPLVNLLHNYDDKRCINFFTYTLPLKYTGVHQYGGFTKSRNLDHAMKTLYILWDMHVARKELWDSTSFVQAKRYDDVNWGLPVYVFATSYRDIFWTM